MELIVPVILTVLSIWLAYIMAKEKNLNIKLWVILALFFGLFAIPFLFFAKSKSSKRADSGHLEA